MRFKVDENLPVEVAAIFTGAGYDADTVFDENLCGAADQKVAAACLAEGRILVTMDLDFADIRAFPAAGLPGAMVFRLSRLSKRDVLQALNRILPILAEDSPAGKLWIVEDSRLRVRSLSS